MSSKGILKRNKKFLFRISINGDRKSFKFSSLVCAEKFKDIYISSMHDKSLDGEIWKNIPNFSLYMASNFGRIKSIDYKKSGIHKVLKLSNCRNGYPQTVLLNDQSEYKNVKAHKMVALAFYGKRLKGYEVDHIDGNKTNNYSDNLEYVTHSVNCKRSFDTGLQKPKRGELNGMAKLTSLEVKKAIDQKKKGGRFWGRNKLAKELGISAKHLQNIVNNDSSWIGV